MTTGSISEGSRPSGQNARIVGFFLWESLSDFPIGETFSVGLPLLLFINYLKRREIHEDAVIVRRTEE